MKQIYFKYISVIIALLLLSITVHSYYYYLYIPQKKFNNITTTYDAIIVPGLPYDEEGWSLFMKWRLYWGVYLYQQKITKRIIFSGSAVHTPYIEAEIMRQYAIKLGVDSLDIIIEKKAEHSTENIYYSLLLAKKLGFKKLALATDPFQLMMLSRTIDNFNLPIDVLPIMYSFSSSLDMIEPIIQPKKAFITSFQSLSDRESYSTRMAGTFGNKINWEEVK